MKKVFLILVLFTININSQTSNSFVLKLKAGLTLSSLSYYNFSKDIRASKYPTTEYSNKLLPSYLLGLGMEVTDIINLVDTYFNFGIEVSYGRSTTGKVNTSVGEAEFIVNTVPVLFWTTLKTRGKIIPFIRIGIGGENSKFSEKYYIYPQYNFALSDWFFCWGLGGGIEYNYSKNINISLFVDWIQREHGIDKKLDDGRVINLDFRSGDAFLGIQFGYALK